ncbi:MAG: ABC transporter substrate-binding protein [Actinomycetota bacterium]|nr:ABC transporter substrate-binding protein [Actinomycetota bacterium]
MRSKLRGSSFVVLLVVLATLLVACGGGGGGSAGGGEEGTGEDRPFPELEEAARGTTVNFFMYGGDDATNAYVDGWIAPRLKEEYDITLKRTPVGDTAEVVNKLLNEKQAGDDEGTVDLVWINGENFYTGTQAKLWFGPWAEELPNARYINWESEEINTDFGTPVDGYEAPWSQAQFVMVYDSAKVQNPPKNMDELRTFTEENPGRFSYPAPPDFTGNAFVEQAFYDVTGQIEPYGGEFDEAAFDDEAPKLYDLMNGIEPNLWREGETYPETSTALDELYGNGEIDLTMSYNPYSAERQVRKGIFPETTRAYLLEGGTLSNTNYVAIPFNGPNKEGAEVVANFLQSPEAQLEMQRTHVVGGLTTLDLEKLPEEGRREFEGEPGRTTIPLQELQENRVPEARTEWLLRIQDGWIENVLQR